MDHKAATSSREVAEQSRQSKWEGESFLKQLFLGDLHPELLLTDDAPVDTTLSAEFQEFYARLENFLRTAVDPAEIDRTGEYPQSVIDGLARLGAFGLKIGKEFGGLGFSHHEYVRVMQLLGSYDANVTALLSAHQSIGVPHPVGMFGSMDLKKRYLPRCAKGAISAFALTEDSVGSDPARLGTEAKPSADGTHFMLNGKKLWCTNGTRAELLVVLATNPDTKRISAFVVETAWQGVHVDHRCHFMGLRALANGVISFHQVKVPRANLIGEEGDGLRIALATLNTGRLSLPAATAGAAKQALGICRSWGNVRKQWGKPIGEHEAIAHQLADMTTTTYAMESIAEVVGMLADRKDRDIRLEAAAAKEWNTVRGWNLTDSALQIRGGRGYETERSLAARGEVPLGIERMLRDSRINRIFEGSSEIMHLFIAREAVDRHLQIAGSLVDPRIDLGTKAKTLPSVIAFYAVWYPRQWLTFDSWFRFWDMGVLGKHMRYAARTARKLARSIFHGMLRYGAGLEQKQVFLFRAVDVALGLFALTATVRRAHLMRGVDHGAVIVADRFATDIQVEIDRALADMWSNDDAERTAFSQRLLKHQLPWLERGIVRLPYVEADLLPETMEAFFASQKVAPKPKAIPPVPTRTPPSAPSHIR